jgi:hypothetical protein
MSLLHYKISYNALPSQKLSPIGFNGEQGKLQGGSGGCSQDKPFFEVNLIVMRKKKKPTVPIKGIPLLSLNPPTPNHG